MERIFNIVWTTIFLCCAAWLWVTWYTCQNEAIKQCGANIEHCKIEYCNANPTSNVCM